MNFIEYFTPADDGNYGVDLLILNSNLWSTTLCKGDIFYIKGALPISDYFLSLYILKGFQCGFVESVSSFFLDKAVVLQMCEKTSLFCNSCEQWLCGNWDIKP